jgi:hypothetical protein
MSAIREKLSIRPLLYALPTLLRVERGERGSGVSVQLGRLASGGPPQIDSGHGQSVNEWCAAGNVGASLTAYSYCSELRAVGCRANSPGVLSSGLCVDSSPEPPPKLPAAASIQLPITEQGTVSIEKNERWHAPST